MPIHTLPHDQIHVVVRHTDRLGPAGIEAAIRILSNDERARCERFRADDDRRDYAVAHQLLRTSLSRYGALAPAEWAFDVAASGKPHLRAGAGVPPLAFNLSHTRGAVACAIAGSGDVGVDVERTDRAVATADLAARYFSAPEAAALALLDEGARQTRFIELWTLKEAYIKALGRGLSVPLDEMSFQFRDNGSIAFERSGTPDSDIGAGPDGPARGWQFALYAPADHLRLAVAVARQAPLRVIARDHESEGELIPLFQG